MISLAWLNWVYVFKDILSATRGENWSWNKILLIWWRAWAYLCVRAGFLSWLLVLREVGWAQISCLFIRHQLFFGGCDKALCSGTWWVGSVLLNHLLSLPCKCDPPIAKNESMMNRFLKRLIIGYLLYNINFHLQLFIDWRLVDVDC